MQLPQIGERWKHFKGSFYYITGFDYGADGDELVLRVRYSEKTDGSTTEFSRSLINFVGPADDRADARFTFHQKAPTRGSGS